MVTRFYRRYAAALLAAAVCSLYPLHREAAALPVNNAVETWLPASDPARDDYDRFRRTFGPEEAVLVALPADTPHRLVEALRVRLERLPSVRSAGSTGSTAAAMADLGVDPATIVRRQTGLLRSADGGTVGLAAVLNGTGVADRVACVAGVRGAVEECGLSDAAALAGTPVLVAELDRLARPEASRPYLAAMLAVCLLVLRGITGRWGLSAAVLGVVAWAVLFTTAAVGWAGGEMNLILAALSALSMVFTLATVVHVLHYHGRGVGGTSSDEGRGDPLFRTLRRSAGPCGLAAATTAAGLLSLTVSDVGPVRQFGRAGAFAAVVSCLAGILLTPAAVVVCGGPRRRRGREAAVARLAALVPRHRRAILVGGLAVVTLAAAGLPRLTAKLDAADLLPPGGRVACDHRGVDGGLTPVDSFEAVVSLPGDAAFVEKLDRVREFERSLAAHPAVRHTLSAASFLPEELPDSPFALASVLSAARERPEAPQFVTAGGDRWRVSVRVRCGPGERTALCDELAAVARRADLDVTLTGIAPLLETAERAIYAGFRDSLLLAALTIALVMVAATGSAYTALAAMVPNLAPLALVFGAAGWAGLPVDVGLMMTGSVALGLAVDGTLHLLAARRSALADGLSRDDAAVRALTSTGPAIAGAGLIAGLGMLALCFSPFPPTARFGAVTAAVLAAAVLADAVLLPAILCGGGVKPQPSDLRRPHFLRRRRPVGRASSLSASGAAAREASRVTI